MPVVNEVLQGLTWEPAAGTLDFRGIRYMLVRPETVVVFQRAVAERLGAQAGTLMCAGGKAGGGATAHRLLREGAAPGEVAAVMCRMGTQLGWGAFRILELDPAAGRLEVAVANSAYAWAHGPSPVPVCHFILGVFAGVAEIALGRPVSAAEVECMACGAPACRFRFQV